jgi:hypothetical protein
MDLSRVIAWCAGLVLASRAADFLIGKQGNRRLKDALFLRTWMSLQSVAPLDSLRESARLFETTVSRIFGQRLFSRQAYSTSTIVGGFVVPILYVGLDFPLGLSRFIDHESSVTAWFASIYVINPWLDMLSFALTRYLARLIANTKRISLALSLWFVDLLCSSAIAVGTFVIVDAFVSAVAPRTGLSDWIGIGVTHDLAVFTAATGFLPVVLHFIFFLLFWVLALAEVVRRGLSYILERFDESHERPLTIVATLVAAVIAFLSAVEELLGSAGK